MNEHEIIERISLWGNAAKRPTMVFEDMPSSDEEPGAENYFSTTVWNELGAEFLAQYWNVPVLFTQEAFNYFLPGIMLVSIREKSFGLFYDSLFGFGYPNPSLWKSIAADKIELVVEWLFWLSEQPWFDELSEDDILGIGQELIKISNS